MTGFCLVSSGGTLTFRHLWLDQLCLLTGLFLTSRGGALSPDWTFPLAVGVCVVMELLPQSRGTLPLYDVTFPPVSGRSHQLRSNSATKVSF